MPWPVIGAGADHFGVAAPLDGVEPLRGELAEDHVRVGVGAVDLVQRDDDRHLGRPGVVDRLDRLRHDALDGRDDQHDHVGHVGAAGTHAGERLVARRVDERDVLLRAVAAVDLDHPRGGVLRDAAGLARGDVGAADLVQQARLAVVDVAEDRDDRRARRSEASSARSRPSNSAMQLFLERRLCATCSSTP